MPAPKPKRVGRPTLPKGNAKAVMLRVRVTPDHLKTMKAMAKATNQSVSEWIRGTLEAAANV
jgi:predicted HicB family RNase H-like nuclease